MTAEDVPLVKECAPISLTYLVSPVTLFSFLLALLLAFIISPVLSQRYFTHYRSFPPDKQVYWNTLPGSTVNAIVLCVLVALSIITGSVDAFHYLVLSKSPIGFAAMQFALGYFVGDLIACLSHSSLRQISLVLHHLSSLSSVVLGLVFEGRWMVLIMARLFTELSTPFVNLLWTLVAMKVPKTSCWFRFAGFGMTGTFIATRILAMPLMWCVMYIILVQEEREIDTVPMIVKVAVVILMGCLDMLNVFWAYKMIRGCFKMLGAAEKNKD